LGKRNDLNADPFCHDLWPPISMARLRM